MNLDTLLKTYYKNEYYEDPQYMGIIEDILDRIENYEDEDEIYQAIDESLIYYADQWVILKHHFIDPKEAKWDEAIDNLLYEIGELAQMVLDTRGDYLWNTDIVNTENF